MHIAFHLNFAVMEDVGYMASNDRLVTAKELNHLALREPHGLVLEADFQANGLVRLIDDDFVLFVRNLRFQWNRRLRIFILYPLQRKPRPDSYKVL